MTDVREEVGKLTAERERMEKRATELASYLTGPGMPGLKGGLDDSEGYPRADIDIHGIVTARHELACLNTDYTELMKRLETALHQLHSESKVYVEPRGKKQETENIRATPFGRVSLVASGQSPGRLAGLEEGDLIIKLGSITSALGDLADIFRNLPVVVQSNRGKPLECQFLRGDELKTTIVTPTQWEGNGLLGFRLEPYVL